MKQPLVFDEDSKTWVWQYKADDDDGEPVNFFYERNELIRFRVVDVRFKASDRMPMQVTDTDQCPSTKSSNEIAAHQAWIRLQEWTDSCLFHKSTLPALQKIELINSETNSIFEPRNQLVLNLIRFSSVEISLLLRK